MLMGARLGLWGAGKRLPYDAEVEYLESTGTQYINTGIPTSATIRLQLTYKYTSTSAAVAGGIGVSGGLGGSASNPTRFFINKDAYAQYNVGIGDAVDHFGSFDTALHTLTLDAQSKTFTVDNTSYTLATTSFTGGFEIPLFARRNSSGVGNFSSGQLYSCKIWDNGVLVRDLIPVRKGMTGALYDRRGVGGMNPDGSARNDGMYFNAGTGDFVLGPDVVPVEYIESHGTEYIDIPVSGTPDEYFGIKGLVKITNTSQSGLAVWDTNTYRQFGASGYSTHNSGYMFASWIGNKNANGGWAVPIGTLAPFEVSVLGITSFGVFNSNPRNIISAFSTLRLFGKYASYNANASAAFGTLTITDGTGNARNFLPVRVGTDATSWEGAMMDTLTRRIYRNAGTGAFTYGADLPYPIGG